MMIKEILEVFPEKRRESLDKAIDLKKKIDLFAELFYQMISEMVDLV